MPRQGEANSLPRKGFPLDFEREAASQFAEVLGLEVAWVYVDARDELIPWLLDGKGDLIASNMTVTAERKKEITFSVPIGQVREVIVTRADDGKLAKPADLGGRKVAARKSSSFWGTLRTLKKTVPTLEMVEVPETLETEEILAGVANKKFDVAVADTNVVDAVFTYRTDLKVAFEVSGDRQLAWGLRPDATELKSALDRYLNGAQLVNRRQEAYKEDLAGIKRRKVLRVLTRNSSASYFLWRGEVLGFEYELAKAFARRIGVRLEVVVAPTREELLVWLDEGKGDLIAASLTKTEERAKAHDFSRPYNFASDEESLATMTDSAATTVRRGGETERRGSPAGWGR